MLLIETIMSPLAPSDVIIYFVKLIEATFKDNC